MTKGQWRIVGICSLIVLAALFIILNMQERIAISFIVAKVEVPLFIALAVSFSLGFLVALITMRKRSKNTPNLPN